MLDVKSRWDGITDRGAWATRGATFMTKVKATKAIWFTPGPVDVGEKAGKKVVSTARKTGEKSAKKASSSGKKTTAAARKSASAATRSTAKKATSAATRKRPAKKATAASKK